LMHDVNDEDKSKDLYQIVTLLLSKMSNFSSSFPILLIGNKSDKTTLGFTKKTKLTEKLSKDLFFENDLEYITVSSKKGTNVTEAYELMIEMIEKYKSV
jgi:GTPase SAR1 family protein